MRELVGHRFDAEPAVFGNEPVDPAPVFAEEDRVLRATHEQAVNFEDFGALQIA
jgi:hypothetical protein